MIEEANDCQRVSCKGNVPVCIYSACDPFLGTAVLKHRSPLLLRRGVRGFSPVTAGPPSPASSLTIANLMLRRVGSGDNEFSLDSDTTLGSISSSDEFVSSQKGMFSTPLLPPPPHPHPPPFF
jgi:hypothetical protein